MVRSHLDLFDGIANFAALMRAARRAIGGKRKKPGAAAFMAGLETEVLRLERALRAGTWRPGRYVEIEVFVPKHRLVSAAPFRDRVAHHALCAVVEPIFEQGFMFDSYANRNGVESRQSANFPLAFPAKAGTHSSTTRNLLKQSQYLSQRRWARDAKR